MVVLLFAGVKPEVLEQHDVARLRGRNGRLCRVSHTVRGKLHRLSEKIGKSRRHRSKRELRFPLTLGSSKVGRQDDGGTLVERISDGRDRRANARVIADRSINDRDVEIDPDKYALPRQVEITNRPLLHPDFDPRPRPPTGWVQGGPDPG